MATRLTTYSRTERPELSSWPGPLESSCSAIFYGPSFPRFYCTREAGHYGRHEAGNLDRLVVAAWDRAR